MNPETPAKIATATSYVTSGGVGVFGYLTLNEWVALAGLGFTAATLGVNLIFRYLHYRLDRRFRNFQMQKENP